MLDTVLHKPKPPPPEFRWHIILQGHFEDLEQAVDAVWINQREAFKVCHWNCGDDQVLICLRWIDDVMPFLVQGILDELSSDIKIIKNGRAQCQGHHT